METEDESGEREISCCRVKVFRDNGAQRKNRDDQKAVEKYLERYLRDHRDGRGTVGAGARTSRGTGPEGACTRGAQNLEGWAGSSRYVENINADTQTNPHLFLCP